MRKLLVKTLDLVLVVGCLVALFAGWQYAKVAGLLGALLGSAILCGAWAALSLICEHLEVIRKHAEAQTKMLDAIDFNVTTVGKKLMPVDEVHFTIDPPSGRPPARR